MEKGFACRHCRAFVSVSPYMGTVFRNHCPFCLWSTHVDWKHPGDRAAKCGAPMEPVGLTFKEEGVDKYGKPIQGELMVVHQCSACQKISINRIAADDEPKAILELFEKSLKIPAEIRLELEKAGIKLLKEENRKEVETQIFGKR